MKIAIKNNTILGKESFQPKKTAWIRNY